MDSNASSKRAIKSGQLELIPSTGAESHPSSLIHTPTHRGDIAELLFCLWAMSEGYEVAKPLTSEYSWDASLYDAADGSTQRIQIKRAFLHHDKLECCLIRSNKNAYTPGDFDVLGVVSIDGALNYDIWWIPAAIVIHQKSVVVGSTKYGQYRVG